MSRGFEISSRRGKKGGGTVLIAHGQRNPITVGIDYKIVCVNDFHAESGLPSLEQKKTKERVKLANWARLCKRLKGNSKRPNLSSNKI